MTAYQIKNRDREIKRERERDREREKGGGRERERTREKGESKYREGNSMRRDAHHEVTQRTILLGNEFFPATRRYAGIIGNAGKSHFELIPRRGRARMHSMRAGCAFIPRPIIRPTQTYARFSRHAQSLNC